MRKKLRERRTHAGLSQAKLAKAAGITQQSYQAIEAGDVMPKPQTAMKIATVLNFPWTEIYEEEDNDE